MALLFVRDAGGSGCVMARRDQANSAARVPGLLAIDGTDRGRDAHAVIDLLHEGADCLHYFRCRARVACPNQLA